MFSATMRLEAGSVDKQRREAFVDGILSVRPTLHHHQYTASLSCADKSFRMVRLDSMFLARSSAFLS